MPSFSDENVMHQIFPFRASIMDYIYKNLTAPQLLKLYQTCKFFYNKFRLNIIEDFEICGNKEDERIVGNSLSILERNPSFSKLNNLWISKSFSYFQDADPVVYTFNPEIFSRLTYSTLIIVGVLDVEEYDFLVKPPTLCHLIVDGVIMDDFMLPIEDLIERAPHVSTLDLCPGNNNGAPLDMVKLLSFDRQTKIQSLYLYEVEKIPNSQLVIDFFMKHATPEIDYYFDFHKYDVDYNVENAIRFFKDIDIGLRTWKLSLEIPPTLSSSFIDLTGKTVVITGASEGVGKATVILFRQLGASVIAIARNFGQLKSLIDECQNIKNDGFLHTVSADIASTNIFHVRKLFDRIFYKFGGKFDILVNNSDTVGRQIIPSKRTIYRDEINVLQGNYNIIRAATPYLKNAKGSVINVKASNGLIIKSENPFSAVNIMCQIYCLENELVSAGVRVNSVCPADPATALPRPDGMNNISYQKLVHECKKSREKQAATAIAFLASDTGKLINGTALRANPLNLP